MHHLAQSEAPFLWKSPYIIGTDTLFTDDAVARIYEYTKGLPRCINQVCTATALMAGLIDQKQFLDESTIRKAIAELDHD